MTTMPVDARTALDSVNAQDLVQKKMAIDAMKKRVNGGPSEEQKLRDACEGFESLFLQKMWEQMRKNVKKEGYLHSRDEEAYQSMFDTELAKKMASAGGIGLGDMLYEQLSQKLTNSSRTTGAGGMREPLPIDPARPPRPTASAPAPAALPAAATGVAPGDLYSEVEQPKTAETPEAEPAPAVSLVAEALAELAAEVNMAGGTAGAPPPAPAFDLVTGAPLTPAAQAAPVTAAATRDVPLVPLPARVSAPGKMRPSQSAKSISRSARHSRRSGAAQAQPRTASPEQGAGQVAPVGQAAPAAQVAPAAAPGQVMPAPVAPSQPLPGQANPAAAASAAAASLAAGAPWPVDGEILKGYGRVPGPDGRTSWSTGMQFAALPGAPVTAPADGVVAFAGEKDGTPHVVLRHEGGIISHYANARALVGEGAAVLSGTQFAIVGIGEESLLAGSAENRSRMGFEIRRGELALNPERFLA